MLTKMNADIEKPELDVITDPFDRTKTIDSLYITVGIITREDAFEEMLQREMIKDTNLFTDNHPTIQRKRAKTMDFTSLAKRPVKGSSISLQLKIAVFQFLSTSFRCELFTLATRGTVTLESDIEHIISTVGPFISFAATTLLTAKENTNTYDPSSPFAFEKLDSSDIDDHDNSNKQEQTSSHGDHSSEKHQPSIVAIVCNPILLNLSSNEQSSKNRLNQQNCNSSSTSSNAINHDHDREKKHSTDQSDYDNELLQRQTTFPINLFPTRSETNITMNFLSSDQNEIRNNNNSNDRTDRPRRACSLFSVTKCSPSYKGNCYIEETALDKFIHLYRRFLFSITV
ncbi:unnamed protein product [Rotaria socialis]|uniref:Uncharacterized protein n=1 Tax=Rotaria socialis TaxID=392032 RepID=A0A820XFM2_9BILA|nr:unnamed protein product [Rotaria socialis]